MTEAEATARAETEKSIQAIREIDEIIDSPSFRVFAAKVEARASKLAETVLDGNVDSETREELRVKRIGLLMALRMLADDREGHASILRGYGITV